MSSEVLRIEGLNIAFGGPPMRGPPMRGAPMQAAPVVKNLSLHIEAGEILGLVGASGSGKSLTARAVMQLLPPTANMSGSVQLQGVNLSSMSPAQLQSVRGRDVGMIFQEPMAALNPLMRIGDQVAETVRLHRRVSRREARDAARVALDQVGLSGEAGALDRLPFELSGGQRQRVAIAMAIVMAPDLLIADEPTTALDVITQAQVLALLRELAKVRGMELLLVTHDLAVIAQLADRVAVIQQGEIRRGGNHGADTAARRASLYAGAARGGTLAFEADPPIAGCGAVARRGGDAGRRAGAGHRAGARGKERGAGVPAQAAFLVQGGRAAASIGRRVIISPGRRDGRLGRRVGFRQVEFAAGNFGAA